MKIKRLIGLLESAVAQDGALMRETTKEIIQLTILELTELEALGIDDIDQRGGDHGQRPADKH